MDKELLTKNVIKLQAGDKSEFESIYDLTKDNLYVYAVYCMRDSRKAEELLQDTYLEVLKSIKNLKDPNAFLTWSKKIMLNLSKHKWNSDNLVADGDIEQDDTLTDDDRDYSPEDNLDVRELKALIRNTVENLPAQQSIAMISFYFDEMSIAEIAEMMDASENTIKTRLYYGRQAIKKQLEKYEEDNDIKLHALSPIPLIMLGMRDFTSQYILSKSAAREILSGCTKAAGIHGSKAAYAAAGKAAGSSAIGGITTNKIVAIVLSVCLLCGGGFGLYKVLGGGNKLDENAMKDAYTGIDDVYVLKGAKDVDYLEGVLYDSTIIKSIKADSSKVDTSKVGTYKIIYKLTVYSDALKEDKKETSNESKTETVAIEKKVFVVDEDKAKELADKDELVYSGNGETVKKSDGSEVAVKQEMPASVIAEGSAHTHTWVNVTKTVNHPAETHQEDVYETQRVCVKDAYDERIVSGTVAICGQCGYRTTDANAMDIHMADEGHSCYFENEYKNVHHDAVYENRQVKTGTKTITDKAAWTETVVTGQKCSSCGAIK